MALNIIVQPTEYSPVNAEIWYSVNSTNSALTDFKYIYTVEKINPITGASTSILGTFKVPPRPVTFDGLFTPHKLLRSELSYYINPFISEPVIASQSAIKFRFVNSYEYNPNQAFIDVTNVAGYAALKVSGNVTANYAVGDSVQVSMSNTSVNPQYNGVIGVLAVTYVAPYTYIKINKTFVTAAVTQPGLITLIRKVGATSSNYWTYTGTRQYDEIDKNFGDQLVFYSSATSSTQTPMTNYNFRYKDIYRHNYETLSLMVNGASGSYFGIDYITYDSSGNFIDSSGIVQLSNSPIDVRSSRIDVPAGPQNIFDSGYVDYVTFFSGAASYEMLIYSRETGGASPWNLRYTKKYKLVENCSPYKKNFRLAFQNRQGGFDYWNFPWRSINSVNMSRTEFRKVLDYNYKVGDRQDTILANKSTETFNISSDWITEYDSNFLKELMTSPEVYLLEDSWEFYDNFNSGGNVGFIGTEAHSYKVGDKIKIGQFSGATNPEYNGVFTIIDIPDTYQIVVSNPFLISTPAEGGMVRLNGDIKYPIIITDSSYTVKTSIDNKLFALSLTFKMANDVNLQQS